ncbi:recombinase family protein [Ruminococcus difficilis]|uniref:Recombinase family protein n=1 Tax=Ruminococcus difficilis TaxID=2763069 RepID=A0A934WSI3_9FIRM|nr:recombinase family protein [Ruminococcus difficilis]MBK6089128.1 recombinase family protein [Ruminococcus difficilis]MDO4892629.1 recombinase family protein [Eubacteriales bacterium]
MKDSFENQANHYKNLIREHPNWKLIDIYSDDVFVDGNPNQNHESFNNLISDCKSGKIDLIITKSISQFCQSLSDSLIVIKELSELPHPVSVIFEIEGICTIGDI